MCCLGWRWTGLPRWKGVTRTAWWKGPQWPNWPPRNWAARISWTSWASWRSRNRWITRATRPPWASRWVMESDGLGLKRLTPCRVWLWPKCMKCVIRRGLADCSHHLQFLRVFVWEKDYNYTVVHLEQSRFQFYLEKKNNFLTDQVTELPWELMSSQSLGNFKQMLDGHFITSTIEVMSGRWDKCPLSYIVISSAEKNLSFIPEISHIDKRPYLYLVSPLFPTLNPSHL